MIIEATPPPKILGNTDPWPKKVTRLFHSPRGPVTCMGISAPGGHPSCNTYIMHQFASDPGNRSSLDPSCTQGMPERKPCRASLKFSLQVCGDDTIIYDDCDYQKLEDKQHSTGCPSLQCNA
uniref:Uncharacterized protein n=1 Tax=Romanomermis culicivorax TaxID=13658 RepID=A0A915JL45_ROMCU